MAAPAVEVQIMSKNVFEQRERAFEAVFFARLDTERIEKLRAKREQKVAMDLLARSSGITDPSLLERILDLGIDATNVQALSVALLVSTAWASGEVTAAERDAALQAAEKEGVSKESGAHQLFESWLDEAPGSELEQTWGEYVRAVLAELEPQAASALKQDLLSRCRQVARASGGFLGVAEISHAESQTLERLAGAMEL
jgi:hypothetical protein